MSKPKPKKIVKAEPPRPSTQWPSDIPLPHAVHGKRACWCGA